MAGTWVPRPPNIASGLPGKGQVAGAENRPPTRSRTGCPWHRRAVGTAGPARASCPAASSPSWACRLLLRVSPMATTAAGRHAGADPALNARPRSLPSWHPHWEAGAPAAPTPAAPPRPLPGPWRAPPLPVTPTAKVRLHHGAGTRAGAGPPHGRHPEWWLCLALVPTVCCRQGPRVSPLTAEVQSGRPRFENLQRLPLSLRTKARFLEGPAGHPSALRPQTWAPPPPPRAHAGVCCP